MKISATMRGDLQLTIKDRTVSTRMIQIQGDGATLQSTFGVQPVDYIEQSDVRLLPGFALIPFKGDGKYTINPGTPREDLEKGGGSQAGAAATFTSSVRVEWWSKDGEHVEYERRAKPCTVEVKDGGNQGRLTCPELTSEAPGGKVFSLDLRWEKP